MKLQYVKAKKVLIVDPFDGIEEQKTPNLAFDFSHHLTIDEDRYACTTEVKVCSVLESTTVTNDFMDTIFESVFLKEDKDEQEEKSVYQESFNQVYLHIRVLLVSLMAAAMLRPFLLPADPPDLKKSGDSQ